LDHSKTGIVG